MELLQGPGTFFFPWPRGQGTGRRKKKQVLAPNPLKSPQKIVNIGILIGSGRDQVHELETRPKGREPDDSYFLPTVVRLRSPLHEPNLARARQHLFHVEEKLL